MVGQSWSVFLCFSIVLLDFRHFCNVHLSAKDPENDNEDDIVYKLVTDNDSTIHQILCLHVFYCFSVFRREFGFCWVIFIVRSIMIKDSYRHNTIYYIYISYYLDFKISTPSLISFFTKPIHGSTIFFLCDFINDFFNIRRHHRDEYNLS